MKTIYRLIAIFFLITAALLNLQAQNRLFQISDGTSASSSIIHTDSTGILMCVEWSSWDFLHFPVGALLPPTKTIKISNCGTAGNLIINPSTVVITPFTYTFDSKSGASVTGTGTGPYTIPVSGWVKYKVKFTPNALGSITKTWNITNNSTSAHPYPITLTGFGDCNPDVRMSITPITSQTATTVTCDFGNVTSGVAITRTINISKYAYSCNPVICTPGPIGGVYSSPNSGISYTVTGTSTLTINFTPVTGANPGNWYFMANNSTNVPYSAGTSIFHIILKANGIGLPEVDMNVPLCADGLTYNIGNGYHTKVITIYNLVTSVTSPMLNFHWANLLPSGGPFSITPNSSTNLSQNSNSGSSFVITFNPTSSGTFLSDLYITNNSTNHGSPYHIKLKGTN